LVATKQKSSETPKEVEE
jgi:hypothetical protein